MDDWSRSFSSRDLTGIRILFLADAVTGKVKSKIASTGVLSHFDALSFLYSAGTWSPDAKQIAYVTYADGDNEINVVDLQVAQHEEAHQAEGDRRGVHAGLVPGRTTDRVLLTEQERRVERSVSV